jgi:hypothetical protein
MLGDSRDGSRPASRLVEVHDGTVEGNALARHLEALRQVGKKSADHRLDLA